MSFPAIPTRFVPPLFQHPLLGILKINSLQEMVFIAEWQIAQLPFLNDYRILDYLFFPGAGLIEIGLSAGKFYLNKESFQLNQMQIFNTLVFDNRRKRTIKTSIKIEKEFSHVSIYTIPRGMNEKEEKRLILHGTFILSNNLGKIINSTSVLNNISEGLECKLNPSLFYQRLAAHKVDYGPTFQVLEDISFNSSKAAGILKDIKDSHPPYLCHPTLIYGSFQLFTILLAKLAQENGYNFFYLPFGIEKITYFSASGQPKMLSIQLDVSSMKADIYLFNKKGENLLAITGFQFTRVSRLELLSSLKNDSAGLVYDAAACGIAKYVSTTLSQNFFNSDFFYDVCALIIIKATKIIDANSVSN